MNDTPTATAVPPPPVPLRKKLLFGAMAVGFALAFLLSLEGLLRLFGVAADTAWQDPFLSFIGDNPLFEAVDGTYRTNPKRKLFNPQHFPVKKAPAAFRFFAVGGSTTYGYPAGAEGAYPRLLALELEKRFPNRRIEDVNAGGIAYASYREVKLVEEALEKGADLILVISGHNEFIEPRFYKEYLPKNPALLKVRFFLNRIRLYAVAKRLVLWISTPLREREHRVENLEEARLPREFKAERYIVRDRSERDYTLLHYERNLTAMAEAAARRGVPILFMTCPSNLRDFRPFVSEFDSKTSATEKLRWKELFDAGARALDRHDSRKALEHWRGAETLDGKPAVLHFMLGKGLDAEGDFAAAKREYVIARDTDAFPHRTPTAFNDAVRRVATRHHTLFLDVMALYEGTAPQGIPGNDIFVDQCHPNPSAHRALARALADVIAGSGLLARRVEATQ